MRLRIIRGLVILGLGASATLGQTPELSFVLPGGSTSIHAGQQITVEVFVEGVVSPTLMKAYQVQIEVVPVAGATGTLSLTGSVPEDSIFVDVTRSDWVFFNDGSHFTAVNKDILRTAALLIVGGSEAVTPEYCSTYIFEAPIDVVGDFQINFLLIEPTLGTTATFLTGSDNLALPLTLPPDGTLTVTVLPPSLEPPNDACIDAFVAFDGTTPFTTVNGTTDGVDLDVTCDEGGGVAIDKDVWYQHVASCTGVLTVSTCNDADFNTRLAVYGSGSSTCPACPTDNTTLLACSDNAAGCALGTSEVSLNVTAGSCFTIRVGGLNLAEGSGNITISCTPDLCDNALAVSPNSTVSGSTANTAVNDAPGLDCGTGLVDSPGAWYSVTGTGNLMTASLCGAASYDSRLSVFEGTCLGLTCVTDANNTCGLQESVSWCSTPGVEYRILVHGAGGASGDFSMTVSDQSCNDGNACTDDVCVGGACTHPDNFDSAVSCCTPSTGGLTTIDDGNPCTTDSCNASTGLVSHTPIADGMNSACNDQSPCTLDQCLSGICVNTDINGLSCLNDGDCPGDATCGGGGLCVCVGATLELVAEPGTLSVAGCYAVGEQVVVNVELGPADSQFIVPLGREIIGAQFFLSYDSTTLSLISVQPGAARGTGSPFAFELLEQVDPVAGTIDYVVGVSFGSETRVPETVAVLTFQALAECDAAIAFRPSGPHGIPNLLTTIGGELEPVLLNPGLLQIDANAPALSACPVDMQLPLDPGQLSVVTTWPTPLATDTCDAGPIQVVCDPPSGTAFAAGTTTVICTVADSCGLQDTCSFNVVVQPSTLTVDVELSPMMAAGPFSRCITFDLWDCDAPADAQHASVKQTLTFVNGMASGVQFQIPGGAWECISARDELHTLRSTVLGLSTLNGFNFVASFVGPRSTGGHWLVGGNLNDDDFVDIRDFGIYFPFFMTAADSDTACGFPGPHANFNGDALVDLLDLLFISGNSLLASEAPCCGAGGAGRGAGVEDKPIMSISVAELRRTKQYGLIQADVNRDGVLDVNDMIAVITGEVVEPPKPIPSSVRGSAPVKNGRSRTDVPRRK